jgi:hypothetical protein
MGRRAGRGRSGPRVRNLVREGLSGQTWLVVHDSGHDAPPESFASRHPRGSRAPSDQPVKGVQRAIGRSFWEPHIGAVNGTHGCEHACQGWNSLMSQKELIVERK